MSGLMPHQDHILEVALIITDSHLNILAESDSWAISQPDSILDNMDTWNSRVHGESGLIERCRNSTQSVADVENIALKFLKKWAKKHQSPMCGNSICQDRRFLAQYMPELESYFHYRNFDVSAFKIAAQLWHPKLAQNIKNNKKAATHEAMADIRASIDEMQFYFDNMLASSPEEDQGNPQNE